MKREFLSGVFLALILFGLCLLATLAPSCRTALQVSTRIYECHQEVKEGGSITLRDCKVTDDDKAEAAPTTDQEGDDAVDVKANGDNAAGTIRAVFTPAALAIVKRSSQASASELADESEAAALAAAKRARHRPRRRKRKAAGRGRVRVAGYTRRRPARRARRK